MLLLKSKSRVAMYLTFMTPRSGQWVLTLEDTTMSQPSRQEITFGTFNCNGFKSFQQSAETLLSNCDILCLQETMLTKQECSVLNSFHDNYYGYGVAPVDETLGVIRVRPRDGVGVLWKKHLDGCVSIIESEYDWLCCVRIREDILKEYYLINVYLPYECTDNTDEFNDCLTKLNVFIDSINSTCVTIVGDFNANLSRASLFGDILLKFCVDNSIDIVDHATLSNDTYTYTSYSWGTTSWLDHVLCTADAKLCTSCLDVRYDCVLSDHHPIIGKNDLNITTVCQAGSGRELNSTLHWDKLSDIAVRHYERHTERGFNNLNIPDGMKCSDPNCQNPSHINDIDSCYDDIFTVLMECSESLVNVNSTRQRHNVPGWNAMSEKSMQQPDMHIYCGRSGAGLGRGFYTI